MHDNAYRFIRATVEQFNLADTRVLDIGGRDANNTHTGLDVHDLFTHKPMTLDIHPGADITADAATWTPDTTYDTVLIAEVFEHTPAWPAILHTAHRALRDGGHLIVTCATLSRPPHAALDGGPLPPGEYYANIDPAVLHHELATWTKRHIQVSDGHFGEDDLHAWAIR